MEDVSAKIVAAAVLGLLVGGVLAFVTGGVLVDREAKGMQTTVDGWSTVRQCGEAGDESNWLPAAAGDFMLWLRAYQPGAAILDGEYTLPPVGEVTTDVASGNAPAVSVERVPWVRILLGLAVLAIVVAYLVRRRRQSVGTDPGRRPPQ